MWSTLGSSGGIINSIYTTMGITPIEVYKRYWPIIFLIANM